jgi:hypothetical protein
MRSRPVAESSAKLTVAVKVPLLDVDDGTLCHFPPRYLTNVARCLPLTWNESLTDVAQTLLIDRPYPSQSDR